MAERRSQRKRRGEREWAEILRRYESSGVGQRAFCAREGVAPSSLQRWRARQGKSSSRRFIDLTPPTSSLRTDDQSWSLELSLPSGVTIRLRG